MISFNKSNAQKLISLHRLENQEPDAFILKHYADQVDIYFKSGHYDDLITETRSQKAKPCDFSARLAFFSLTDCQIINNTLMLVPDQVGLTSNKPRQIGSCVQSSERTKYFYNSTPIIKYEKRNEGDQVDA